MIASLTRFIVICAVVFGLLAGAGLRLDSLFNSASGVSDGDRKPEKKAEDRELFLSLVRYRVIQPRPDGGLDVMPPDYFLVQRAEGKADKLSASQRKERESQRRLHGILYFAPIGGLIRAQVGLWNNTRYMAAIRDNRTRPPGDFTNSWEILSAKGHPLLSGNLVPENFGFVLNGQLTAGYSDWATVSRRNERVTFRTTIQPTRASVLSVQIAGKPISWSPRNAKVIQLDGKEQFGCGEAKGGVLRLALKPTARPITITVTVEPSVNCERKINGLAIRQTKDAIGKYTAFDWRPIKRSSGTAGSFVITTGDGIALTDPDGKGTPTQAAYDLGLVPLIGFGPAASFSLSGMMAASKLPPQGVSVALTIDSRVQRAAQKALLKQIKRMGFSGRYAKKRKGAVVVLDADTGAILAVAGYPTVPAGARPWDYAAFGAAFPLRDPSTVMAWGIVDENNSPGSTFKPVVSLSVMHSATPAELPLFRRIMEGLSAAEIFSVYGLRPGQSEYFPAGPGSKGIANFANGGLGPFGSASRNRACVKTPPTFTTFGLRQAVQYSVNVWFARLSVLLDERNIARIVDDLVASKRKGLFRLGKPSRLIEAVRWLGIDDRSRMDLASNLPPGVRLQRYNTGASADVLFPQVSRQAFTDIEIYAVPGAVKTLRHIAALNGIGQSVSVHPLHMARAAMAVASGKRILPYIFDAWGGQKLSPPPARKLGIDLELLQILRDGMKAVPEVGTAAGKFPGDLMCRTYGKTGTAEIVKSTGQHSAWFIGWREPKAPVGQRDRKNPKDRRLAFGCMVTHGFGGFRTGGSSCAPVVSDILQALEAKDKKTKKKRKTTRHQKRSN